ncbi:MAG: EAL domain-containing protein [Clostridiaceae bacterium]|nr:EAL domain-containing protein [Clostridiaceae bacterium]
MKIYNVLIYFVIALIFSLLILIYILLRNIQLRTRAEKELRMKNEELTAIYEENIASDEELKENIHELIQKQEELGRSGDRYRIVAESTMDIIWEGDLINKKRFFSEKVYDILGYKSWELEDLDLWFTIIHPEDLEWVKEGIKHQVDEKIALKTFEYRVKCKTGNYKWLLSNTKCEFDENGRGTAVFGAFTDISELKEQQQKINNLAYYDSVTGLPNRVRLREVVSDEIENCAEINSKFALIFMDLDNFKYINDSYGHMTGDKLLLETGKRLVRILNENMTAFKLGGDEFIILIKASPLKEEVEVYSKALLESLASPISIDGDMFHVTHSSGIVFYPENGLSFDELLKNADTAMYKSKESGKNTYTFYHRVMGNLAMEKIKMQANLEIALENKEFLLYYQPIIDVALGKITGFEALIRWIHPKNGFIFPDRFIGAAEESGIIIQIGKWVIISACKYAKSIYDSGFRNFYISVNVSALQIMQKDFTDFVLSTIEDIGLPAELILIEITESVLVESMDLVIAKLNILKDNNIKIALDDFGCGYSSLTYMRMLPINTIKIDKSFIDDIKSEDDVKSLTGNIILLAKQLGLNVIGEGVETQEQLDYLKRHGCDMFQGYLVSKPVPAVEIDNLLKREMAS